MRNLFLVALTLLVFSFAGADSNHRTKLPISKSAITSLQDVGAGTLWVGIASPEDGSTISAGKTNVYPMIASPNGFSKCEGFADGVSIGSFGPTSPKFYFTWKATTGVHILTATLTDHSANTVTSDPIKVTVN